MGVPYLPLQFIETDGGYLENKRSRLGKIEAVEHGVKYTVTGNIESEEGGDRRNEGRPGGVKMNRRDAKTPGGSPLGLGGK